MLSIVDTKLTKLAQAGFTRFERNWLSIYDNLPLPHVHLEQAVAILLPLLQSHWSKSICSKRFSWSVDRSSLGCVRVDRSISS